MAAIPHLCSSSTAHVLSSSRLQPRMPRSTAGVRTRPASCNDGNASTAAALHRRDVLLGLGGLYCATNDGLVLPGQAFGTPVQTPPFSVELTSRPVSTLVRRPKKSRSKKEKEDEEEVLVVKGIEFDGAKFNKFDVFVNSPENTVIKPVAAEFAGSFVGLPRGRNRKKTIKSCLRLALTDLLDNINADDDDDIIVTLVPIRGQVKIDGVEIEFLNDDF